MDFNLGSTFKVIGGLGILVGLLVGLVIGAMFFTSDKKCPVCEECPKPQCAKKIEEVPVQPPKQFKEIDFSIGQCYEVDGVKQDRNAHVKVIQIGKYAINVKNLCLQSVRFNYSDLTNELYKFTPMDCFDYFDKKDPDCDKPEDSTENG